MSTGSRAVLVVSIGIGAICGLSCAGGVTTNPEDTAGGGAQDASAGKSPRAGAGTASGGDVSVTPNRPGGTGATGQVEQEGGAGGADPRAMTALSGPAFFDFDCGEGGELPPGNACAECERSACATELSDTLGTHWASGQNDGPCAAWFGCIQACSCNEQPCYKSCLSHLGEGGCEQPFLLLDACITDRCQPLCSSSSSG